jgi:hypothetical protein
MKPGTVVRLPDGREGTVVFHSLTGYGIVWGARRLSDAELEMIYSGNGSLFGGEGPSDCPRPEAMLRDHYPTADLECVGEDYEIVSVPGSSRAAEEER